MNLLIYSTYRYNLTNTAVHTPRIDLNFAFYTFEYMLTSFLCEILHWQVPIPTIYPTP